MLGKNIYKVHTKFLHIRDYKSTFQNIYNGNLVRTTNTTNLEEIKVIKVRRVSLLTLSTWRTSVSLPLKQLTKNI